MKYLNFFTLVYTIIYFTAPRPECTTDPECPDHLACIREKCQNPCFTTTCGVNAECRVTRHRAICYCKPGYEGDPYRICEERKQEYFYLFEVQCQISHPYFFTHIQLAVKAMMNVL